MGNERTFSHRLTDRPPQFMFIDCDSSNGGLNAKPDKSVRSFVMKSARHKKSWSTRPKGLKADRSTITKSRRRSPSNCVAEQSQAVNNPPRLGCPPSVASWDAPSVVSASSSQSNSIFSMYSGQGACESPASSSTSSCIEHETFEDMCDFSLPRQTVLLRHTNFGRSLGSFDCLSVRLDADAERLLHRCKCHCDE
jgi:hypothetical protein